MKWIKTVIGALLILAAIFAIYYWNIQGKEKVAGLETEEPITEEVVIDPNVRVYSEGKSYFVVKKAQIKSCSSLLKVGDYVAVYSLTNKERLIKGEIAAINESNVELICSIDEYYTICDHEFDEQGKKEDMHPDLIFAMEGNDE